jgi:hypothetical protein
MRALPSAAHRKIKTKNEYSPMGRAMRVIAVLVLCAAMVAAHDAVPVAAVSPPAVRPGPGEDAAVGGPTTQMLRACLAAMLAMDHQWAALFNATVANVGLMATRIVTTEGLIVAEGRQIGRMAGRVLATAAVMEKLTATCLRCNATRPLPSPPPVPTPSTLRGASAAISGRWGGWYSAPQPPARAPAAAADDGPGPNRPIAAFVNHTLALMTRLSGDVAAAVGGLEARVLNMSGRILATERLIMNVSRQIGAMAGRIVATEKMMAATAAACCHRQHSAPGAAVRLRGGDANGGEQRVLRRTAMTAPSAVKNEGGGGARSRHPGGCSPLDPLCWMVAAADAAEDAMFVAATAALKVMAGAADDIGSLASDIVAIEGDIAGVAAGIGELAGGIVAVERAILAFGTEVCNATGAPATAAAGGARGADIASGLWPGAASPPPVGAASARRTGDAPTAGAAPPLPPQLRGGAGAFAEGWLALLRQMAGVFVAMGESFTGAAAAVAEGMASMAGRVAATARLVAAMAAQVADMSARMRAMAASLDALANTCRGTHV